MIKITALSICLFVMLLQAGCAPIPVKMQDMTNRKIMLTPDQEAKTSKRDQILIIPNDKTPPGSEGTALNRKLENKILTLVSSTGIQIIDKSLEGKLISEFRRCEIRRYTSGGTCFSSKIPGFVIYPTATSVTPSADFSPARSYVDDDGKKRNYPASCTYKLQLDGIVNIYLLQDLHLQESINITGTGRISQNSNNKQCPISNATMSSLISEAVNDLARYHGAQIKNQFAPTADIIEYRWGKKPSDNFFRLSIGTQEGIHPNMEVIVVRNSNNRISNASGYDFKEEIARGIIVDTNSPHREAWFQVKSKEHAIAIQPGDTAKIIHQEAECSDKSYRNWCNLFNSSL